MWSDDSIWTVQRVTCKMMMQMPSNSFLGHPGLQSNYQSMMIGAESQRLLPCWNYPPPPPPPTHTAGSAGSSSVFNCLPIDRPSSNDEKSIQGQTQHQQLTSSSTSSSIPFTGSGMRWRQYSLRYDFVVDSQPSACEALYANLKEEKESLECFGCKTLFIL